MIRNNDLSKNFQKILIASSFLIYCFAAPYIFFFIASMIRHPSLHHFVVLSYIWQTLVAAVFAIIAATIGAGAVLYQVDQTTKSEMNRSKMRAMALRAVLPLALSELSDYAKKCADVLIFLLSQQTNGIARAAGIEFPSLPSGLVAGFTDLIETSDEAHSRPLIDLIRRLQIQHARALDIQERATGKKAGSLLLTRNLISAVFDAAEIFARCSALFIYSRGEAIEPAPSITFKLVADTLSTLLISYQDVTPFTEAFNRLEETAKKDGIWPIWSGY